MLAWVIAALLAGVKEDALAANKRLDELNQKQDYAAMEKEVDQLLLRDWSKDPEELDLLQRAKVQLAFRACERLDREPSAAGCYRSFARAYPKDALAPDALYDALVLLAESNLDASIDVARELAGRYPKNPLAPRALFSASNRAERQRRYEDAAALAEEVLKDWPSTREGEAAVRNAMVLRAVLGECDVARRHGERYFKQVKKGSDDEKAARRVLKSCAAK